MNRTLIKIFLSVLVFLISIIPVFGINAAVKMSSGKGMMTDFKSERELAFTDLVQEVVPELFQTNFINASSGLPVEHRILLLAQAEIESGWIVMETKPNNNGSVDLGPLGLNSNNVKDKWFINKFWPFELEEDVKEINIMYMVACINFFKSLMCEFETPEKVLIAYNAGPGAARTGRIPARTKLYIKWVSESFQKLSARFDELVIYERIEALKNKIKESKPDYENVKRFTCNLHIDVNNDSESVIHPVIFERKSISVVIPWTITRTWVEVFDGNDNSIKSGFDTVILCS